MWARGWRRRCQARPSLPPGAQSSLLGVVRRRVPDATRPARSALPPAAGRRCGQKQDRGRGAARRDVGPGGRNTPDRLGLGVGGLNLTARSPKAGSPVEQAVGTARDPADLPSERTIAAGEAVQEGLRRRARSLGRAARSGPGEGARSWWASATLDLRGASLEVPARLPG